jgi:small subunit ribosomal protein S14
MAKSNMLEREKRRQALAKKHGQKRVKLREIIRDPKSSHEQRAAAQEMLQKLPRDSNPNRQRSRCSVTGRSRGVYRKFGLGRQKLREATMKGEIPGLRKASW